ncbi:NUDIX domain-containing protein [Candidatus Parcubacteria bacterium]|nr:NUDIX domain-containing protein [Candidatus Parcubacteria bacterium]
MKITICGSSVFAKQMVAYRDQLIKLGHEVNLHEHYVKQAQGEMVNLIERMGREHALVKKEYDYIRYHYNEIINSDAILVLNFDKNGIKNYIGGNTLMEMGFAYVNNKKIFLINPVPEKVGYVDEIEAMEPIILAGDLSQISNSFNNNQQKVCDNKSVGILVWKGDKLLLIERKKFPFGFAPPAGHVDEHGSFEQAAKNELKEEIGLDTLSLKLAIEGKKENPCRRGGTWHYWKIYQAQVSGELSPSKEETKQAGWYSKEDLQKLAERTKQYLAKEVNEKRGRKLLGLKLFGVTG